MQGASGYFDSALGTKHQSVLFMTIQFWMVIIIRFGGLI